MKIAPIRTDTIVFCDCLKTLGPRRVFRTVA